MKTPLEPRNFARQLGILALCNAVNTNTLFVCLRTDKMVASKLAKNV